MNHVFGFRDHFGPSCHPGEVMSRIGIISFNRMGVGFAADVDAQAAFKKTVWSPG
jgi:hypothetical protein